MDHKLLSTCKHIINITKTHTINDVAFTVTDYKIMGKGDDYIYEKHYNIWENLPRGFATIKHNDTIIRTVCGLRKFGNEGIYTSPLSENEISYEETYMNKANGEYCSVSAFKQDEIIYFVIRSKNVSLIVRPNNVELDLAIYEGDRYLFSRLMTIAFFKKYNSLTQEQQNNLIKIILENTINMEYCSPDYQHIIDYHGKETLFPFAITRFSELKYGLTSYLPDDALDIFLDLGFEEIPFSYTVYAVNKSETEKIRNQIYEQENSEGAVVYKIAIDMVTKQRRVYEVYKYKNYHYIFWRAVREKMRGKSPIGQLVNRLNNLHCHINELESMIHQAIKFYAYCWNLYDTKWLTVFSSWVTYYKDFLNVSEESKIDYLDKFKAYDVTRSQLQLMTIALPGSGKSTTLKVLEKLLPNAMRVNQDECQKSAKIYHKKVGTISKDKTYKTLLLDKSYHNKQVRSGTFGCIAVQNMVYIVFYHPNDLEENDDKMENRIHLMQFEHALKLAKKRINIRGAGHLNLYPAPTLDGILDGFIKSYEPLTEFEELQSLGTIYIDMTMDRMQMVKTIMDGLNKLGIIDLPKLNDTEIIKAIDCVQKEEIQLALTNTENAKTLYWSAILESDISKIPLFEKLLSENKHMAARPEFHCTMLYVNGNSKINEDEYRAWENKEIDVLATGISYDSRAMALVLEVEFPCTNPIPHMTLALAPDTPPYHSNTMLIGNHTNIKFDEPVMLNTKIIRHLIFK